MVLKSKEKDYLIIQIKNFLNYLKETGTEIKEECINDVIDVQSKMMHLSPDVEDRKQIKSFIEQEFHVYHSEPGKIFNEYTEARDWYSSNPPTEEYFWSRYRKYLLGADGPRLDLNSVIKLEGKTLLELMDCLGDPKLEDNKCSFRRGLVIGDVQSGKTSTYSGLICKAIDSGYKVIILLAGITESLRAQTQERVDEGIIGYSLVKNEHRNQEPVSVPVGVGKNDNKILATSYTSRLNDFVSDGAASIMTSLQQYKGAVVFVIKKNAKILENLYCWLNSSQNVEKDGLIHEPMLLIDDEADNASINTRKDDNSPTAVNRVIREICASFRNATYVGFTATPFANIFIDPDSPAQMYGADLFPENFIYVLPIPSTYIGATKLFFEDGKYYRNLRWISDVKEPDEDEIENSSAEMMAERPYYMAHKKEWHGELPESLEESLLCFIIANVVRDLRNDSIKPRTMMINISRFVRVQKYISEYINDKLQKIKNIILFDFSDIQEYNKNNTLYKRLEGLYLKHFSNIAEKKEDILDKDNLYNAIKDINVLVVNSGKSSAKLDYKKNNRIIAVGGMALSRGLTLEGLLVSYFYRNTAMFDVLMQMGRWFGYRFGYDDIFQIWTSHQSAEWYAEVARSSEELKEDVNRMFEEHLTPRNFGLKVRSESDLLQITARNKMRNSHNKEIQISFLGEFFETPYACSDKKYNEANHNAVNILKNEIKDLGLKYNKTNRSSTHYVLDVPKDVIIHLLKNIKTSKKNPKFDEKQIMEFLMETEEAGLDKWNVVIRAGSSKTASYQLTDDISIPCLEYTVSMNDGTINFSSRGVLCSPSDGALLIDDIQKQRVKERFVEENGYDRVPKTIPNYTWFRYSRITERKPELSIYMVNPSVASKDIRDKFEGEPIVGFGIGIPGYGCSRQEVRKYKVNNIYYHQMMEDSLSDDEVDDYD